MTDQTKTAAQRHDDEFLCRYAAYLERLMKQETEIFVELHRQNIGDKGEKACQ